MKVSIIGAGNVGSMLAERVLEEDLADVVLVDIAEGLAKGKALDIMHSASTVGFSGLVTGTADLKDTKNSDIIVIAAGLARKPGMTREDLAAKNKATVKDIVKNTAADSPDAILIMVTNPLDLMTYVAYRESGFKAHKVMGMAGALDSARFAYYISRELNVRPDSVDALVIGGHDDTMVPLVSQTRVAGKPLSGLIDRKKAQVLTEKTKKAGSELVGLLGGASAYYAPSAAVLVMIKSILKDEKKLIALSAYVDGQYGIKGSCIGVPAVLGRRGIEKIEELNISAGEREALNRSSEAIKKQLDLLDI